MPETRVRAIRFEQRGRVLYTVVMEAAGAIEVSKVDVWSATANSEKTGYQRTPSSVRVRGIASFLEGSEAIMPVGGLLNARSEGEDAYGSVLQFEPDPGEDGSIQKGWLTIPAEARPLWIVDMQHRLACFEHAIYKDGRTDLADFPVTFTIADGLSQLDEVSQFELINTTQKKVRTDLARRLMAIQAKTSEQRVELDRRGRLWEARGSEIADWLGKHGAIWKGRIVPPNSSKKEVPDAIVRETSFVTSLKPILQTPLFQRMSEEQVAQLIDRYWQAVAMVFPEAFEWPADNVIQKTPGVFSLHSVAPEVVELVRTSNKELTAPHLHEAMMPWRELDGDFWAADNEEGAAKYGSMKGFARLAAELREMLPAVDYQF